MLEKQRALIGQGFTMLTSDDRLAARTRRRLAILFLSIAVILGTMTYSTENSLLFGLLPPKTSNYSPDLGSGLIALALLFPLYTRGIMHWRGLSLYGIIIFVLSSWALAIAVSIIMGQGSGFEFLGLSIPNTAYVALFATLGLLYLGMRPFASLAAVIFFALAAFNVALASAMGIFGFFFIIAVVLGFLCQNDIHPVRLMGEVRESWSGSHALPAQPEPTSLSTPAKSKELAP